MIRVPAMPGSIKEARRGELGLKNGPAVWGGVGAPLSTQLGVGARVRGWATARPPARATAVGSTSAAPRNSGVAASWLVHVSWLASGTVRASVGAP